MFQVPGFNYKMRVSIISFIILLFALPVVAQQGSIRGIVSDGKTGETLIGANILIGEGRGTVTDFDGKFVILAENGTYDVQVSYVGYETTEQTVEVSGKPVYLEFNLSSLVIDEVIVVADVARSRETPVAFTNILPKKIEEELAGQDIPMILNSTPGVYATNMGGGDGDARITIRGFNQRNIGVMIDGLPVNDMENGWVYWSNWFGLNAVTRTIQVQRGLGASKLALPSVGGTLNIITKGLEAKRETKIKQEINSQGKTTTSIGFTSGKLANGWGITLAGSYKRGNGWVENTFSEAWFYYAKVDKRLSKHLLSATAMGSPQNHNQRSYKRPIATYDSKYARELGIPVDSLDDQDNYPYQPEIFNRGIKYNQHWGYFRRDRFDADAPEEMLSERTNIYYKPQFTLRDYWMASDRLSVSNILYLSVGKGGGVRPRSSIDDNELISDPADPRYGTIDWQSIYDVNSKPTSTPFGQLYPINQDYSDSLYYSSNYMTEQHNDHFWYGLLSTANFQVNNQLSLAAGIDLRSYKGIHYTTVTDLFGGDYVIDKYDDRNDYTVNPSLAMKYEGDTISYHEEGLVKWGGLFFQAEYKLNQFTTFVNLTSALNGYKRINYFDDDESAWKWTPGFTFKSGANYNLNQNMNVFLNLGYLSKVRTFRYFFVGYTTAFEKNTENEKVMAFEGGYNFHSARFTANVNAYYTKWKNKPTYPIYSYYYPDPEDPERRIRAYANIPGMDALHKGIEVDFIYKVLSILDVEGLVSLGDWKWDKKFEGLQFFDSQTHEQVDKTIDFDARGIHVGDAAQFQMGGSVRLEPVKGLYLNTRITHFGKYFSDFSPESTTDDDGNPIDSWKIPDYRMVDFHAGYRFKVRPIEKVNFSIRFSILNLMNKTYIADATNNDPFHPLPFNEFDAKSATVFFGMGRRFTTSFSINF